jgi:NADPH-dependent glutamate synthase beta subunit-like oxidoreductase
MDVMIEAIGQTADNNLARILPGVTVADGLIRTQPNSFATSRPGIYAGGDIVRGPSTVAAAVADGMKAAAEIDAFLKQKRG